MAHQRAVRRILRGRPKGRSRRSALRVWLWLSACAGTATLLLVLAGVGAKAVRGQAESPQAKPAQQDQGKQNPSDQAKPNPPAQPSDQSAQKDTAAPGSEVVPGDPDATMAPDPDAPPPAPAATGSGSAVGHHAAGEGAVGVPSGGASGATAGPVVVPVAAEVPAVPARPLTPAEQRKQNVASECADLLKLATDLKSAVDKSSKDELSIGVIRKAGEIEQYAHKVRTAPQMTAGKN